MPDFIFSPDDPLWETLVSTIIVFILIIAITRIVGLRSFAKFSVFDFAFTVAVGSIVASILTSTTSIAQGAIAIGGLLSITVTVAYLQKKSEGFDELISNKPLLLMQGDFVIEENLEASRVSKDQLMAKLREANVIQLSQVKAVVLETTGDISVLHSSDEEKLFLDEEIMRNVRTQP